LVDLQRMAYPHKWSPISYKSSAGQRKDTGQRPMLYRWTTQPGTGVPASYDVTLQRSGLLMPRLHHTTGCETVNRLNIRLCNRYCATGRIV